MPDVPSLKCKEGFDASYCLGNAVKVLQKLLAILLPVMLLLLAVDSRAELPRPGIAPELEQAVSAGDVDSVASLLAKNESVDRTGLAGFQLLNLALERSDISMVRLLLGKGVFPDNKSRRTMLLIGALSGNGNVEAKTEIADLLLARGVKVNGRIDPDEAAEIGDSEELVAKRDSDDSGLDLLDYATPLIALPGYDLELTRYLLEKGADVNARSRNGYTALSISVERYIRQPSAETKNRILLLLEHGANPEQNIRVTKFEKQLAPLRKIDFTITDLATVIQDADFVEKLKAQQIVPKATPLTGLLAETLRTLKE